MPSSPQDLLAKWGWTRDKTPIIEKPVYSFQSSRDGLGSSTQKSSDWHIKLLDSTLSSKSILTEEEIFLKCGGIIPSKGARRRKVESSDSSSDEEFRRRVKKVKKRLKKK